MEQKISVYFANKYCCRSIIGSALNLNIHLHMLLLDGVYTGGHDSGSQPRFKRVKAPDRAEPEQQVTAISERTGRHQERQGLRVRGSRGFSGRNAGVTAVFRVDSP